MNLDINSQSFQVSINVFIDDLELAIKKLSPEDLHLFNSNESTIADSLVSEYLRTHFVIRHNESIIELKYIGKEISDDLLGAWCYFESGVVAANSLFNLRNTILLEEFEDQKNITEFRIDNSSKNFKILDVDIQTMILEL